MWKRKASEEEGCEVEEILQPVKKTGRTARARPSNRAANSTLKKSKSASSSAKSAKSEIRRNADPLREPEGRGTKTGGFMKNHNPSSSLSRPPATSSTI
ncbi:hypothetical protein V8C43DRAFT_320609 [Trichoderma afarasin]